MPDFVMIMRGRKSPDTTNEEWQVYIEQLVATGKFRGGSAFGNSHCFGLDSANAECVTSGFMRFEADSIEEIKAFVTDNPVYKAGGEVELHELVVG